MSFIHPTAIIDDSAVLGQDVYIGPYCLVGPQSTIGNGSKLNSHVVIEGYTKLGSNCTVSAGAVLGGLPQDLGFKGETSWVEIGDNCVLRECVTVNRASGENNVTRMGNDCMIMAYSHLGHNVKLGNRVIIANTVQMGGFAEVHDSAFVGGVVAIHQHCKIGRLAMISGACGTRQDLPPFSLVEGRPQAMVVGINRIGLKRNNFSNEERNRIKKAFQILFFSRMIGPNAITAVEQEVEIDDNIRELLDFVRNSKRGIQRPDLKVSGRGRATEDVETEAIEAESVTV